MQPVARVRQRQLIVGRPFFVKTVRPMRSDRCLSCLSCRACLSVCSVLSVTLVYCGQTVGWIKMNLDMHVSLGPCRIVLGGDSAPSPQRGLRPLPNFRHISIVTNGWMHEDATWYGGILSPGDFVLDGDPAPLPQKGADPIHNFRPTF